MIELVKWDSAFFDCTIGKYEAQASFHESKFLSHAREFDIVYIFSKSPIDIRSSFNSAKLTFYKEVVHKSANVSSIRFFSPSLDEYDDLLHLAYQSGHESRFLRDPFFGEKKFFELYKAWIDKNLHAQDEYVLVYLMNDKIEGFVSYRISDTFAAIELIAVSPEHQGKGIGNKLLNAVEHNLKLGTKLLVSTQEVNTQACIFYERYGFELFEKLHIYHYVPSPI